MSIGYWRTEGKKVKILKAVVSPTGHVVSKNYDRMELREGDVGLEVRLDKNQVEHLTPEQKRAAVAVARSMSGELLQTLGAEAQPGFGPGMVVSAGEDTGIVEAVTDFGLTLKTLDEGDRWRLMHVPFATGAIQQVADGEGESALVGYLFECNCQYRPEKSLWPLIPDWLVMREINHGSFPDWVIPRLAESELLAKIKDESLLLAIAKNKNLPEALRKAALSRISIESENLLKALVDGAIPLQMAEDCGMLRNQVFLLAIAKKTTNPELIQATIARITDQSILKSIVSSNDGTEIRVQTLARIEDQEVINALAEDQNCEVACAAIAKATNQDLITRLATEHRHFKIRETAVKQLQDQKLLAKIVKTDEDEEVRLAAVRRILDQQTLFAVAAKRSEIEDIRVAAAERLDNPELKARCIRRELKAKAPSRWVLMACFTNIKDQELLLEFATSKLAMQGYYEHDCTVFCMDGATVVKLAQYLRDQTQICGCLCDACCTHLADCGEQEVLVELVKTAKTITLRRYATQRIEDQALLLDVAWGRILPGEGLEQIAVKAISDQHVLADLAMKHGQITIGLEALHKITDTYLCFEVARKAGQPEVIKEAVGRIEDKLLLEKLERHFRNTRNREMEVACAGRCRNTY